MIVYILDGTAEEKFKAACGEFEPEKVLNQFVKQLVTGDLALERIVKENDR